MGNQSYRFTPVTDPFNNCDAPGWNPEFLCQKFHQLFVGFAIGRRCSELHLQGIGHYTNNLFFPGFRNDRAFQEVTVTSFS